MDTLTQTNFVRKCPKTSRRTDQVWRVHGQVVVGKVDETLVVTAQSVARYWNQQAAFDEHFDQIRGLVDVCGATTTAVRRRHISGLGKFLYDVTKRFDQ